MTYSVQIEVEAPDDMETEEVLEELSGMGRCSRLEISVVSIQEKQ